LLSDLDVVREHQMVFDLMKVNSSTVTWRIPNGVLQTSALKVNDK